MDSKKCKGCYGPPGLRWKRGDYVLCNDCFQRYWINSCLHCRYLFQLKSQLTQNVTGDEDEEAIKLVWNYNLCNKCSQDEERRREGKEGEERRREEKKKLRDAGKKLLLNIT